MKSFFDRIIDHSNPEEYFVIADTLDYMFSEMIIYNVCSRNIPLLNDSQLLKKEFMMRIGSQNIHSVNLKDAHGGVYDEKGSFSSVYIFHEYLDNVKKFSWLNSQTPFLMINPNSGFGLYNYCTPGQKGFNEY